MHFFFLHTFSVELYKKTSVLVKRLCFFFLGHKEEKTQEGQETKKEQEREKGIS